jgi:hypothetical protein
MTATVIKYPYRLGFFRPLLVFSPTNPSPVVAGENTCKGVGSNDGCFVIY